MLNTNSLHFAYNNDRKFQFPNIALQSKQALLVFGESGIGKTTLLHLLAGMLTATSGSVEIDGTDLTQLSTTKLDHFRGQHIGIVFQRPRFISSLTLSENLYLAQFLAGKKQDGRRITSVLERLSISRHSRQKPHRLSQGEQQRAAIALALINQPRLILADEPTSSLDDKNCRIVSDLVLEHASATDTMLVVISHDQRLKEVFHHTLELSETNISSSIQYAS